MSRYYSLEHNTDAIPPNDTIHCHTYGCRMLVAFFNDYIPRIFVFQHYSVIFQQLIFLSCRLNQEDWVNRDLPCWNTYCSQCENMIGWKMIAVTQPSKYITQGRFVMKLDKLRISNNERLIRPIQEQNFRANEENADQDGETSEGYGDSTEQEVGSDEQNGDSTDQDGDTADQGLGANEQNIDQDGDSVEEDDGAISNYLKHLRSKNANQDGGANEQNADQVVGANEQNADQVVGANEQNVDQDGSANEQNADQHGGTNEQNHDQGGGANEQNADQHGGANEQNADQHGGANGQNRDQDGVPPTKRRKI
ncbi:uncharacterized protein LOC125807698 [Solanum verrucosum]|uniref:uncharacterized protein LOC125807698 n=1 Tax=Solanum verrucosum TaxID=315347 RepID=UPI0020D0B0EE|nr:uncharacterized protein LOC125807698 [Solanum verrucosum]